ncbi:MAG: hypothetical protein IPL33_16300 [Sphingobacteriales bacterium]|nr:hypothetical protein [Sphingobacteriales bacterium]
MQQTPKFATLLLASLLCALLPVSLHAQFAANAAEFARQIEAQYAQVTMREDMRAELDEFITNVGDASLMIVNRNCSAMQRHANPQDAQRTAFFRLLPNPQWVY